MVSPAVFEFWGSWNFWLGTNIVCIRLMEFVFATSLCLPLIDPLFLIFLRHSQNIIPNQLQLWPESLGKCLVLFYLYKKLMEIYLFSYKGTTNKDQTITCQCLAVLSLKNNIWELQNQFITSISHVQIVTEYISSHSIMNLLFMFI